VGSLDTPLAKNSC